MKEITNEKDFLSLAHTQIATINEISEHVNLLDFMVDNMIEAWKKANSISSIEEKVSDYNSEVKPFFEKIRYHTDKLELIVDDEL